MISGDWGLFVEDPLDQRTLIALSPLLLPIMFADVCSWFRSDWSRDAINSFASEGRMYLERGASSVKTDPRQLIQLREPVTGVTRTVRKSNVYRSNQPREAKRDVPFDSCCIVSSASLRSWLYRDQCLFRICLESTGGSRRVRCSSPPRQ